MPAIDQNMNIHLGIPELDKTRQVLVKIVNLIDEALLPEKSREYLAGMLKHFAQVTREYIVLERGYLPLYQNTDITKNKREDAVEKISREIISALILYLEGGKGIDKELLDKITNRLTFHLGATPALKAYQTEIKKTVKPPKDQGDK